MWYVYPSLGPLGNSFPVYLHFYPSPHMCDVCGMCIPPWVPWVIPYIVSYIFIPPHTCVGYALCVPLPIGPLGNTIVSQCIVIHYYLSPYMCRYVVCVSLPGYVVCVSLPGYVVCVSLPGYVVCVSLPGYVVCVSLPGYVVCVSLPTHVVCVSLPTQHVRYVVCVQLPTDYVYPSQLPWVITQQILYSSIGNLGTRESVVMTTSTPNPKTIS